MHNTFVLRCISSPYLTNNKMTHAELPESANYLTRHEDIIHQNNDNSDMAHETQSNSSTGSQYLQDALGDVLADALSKVAKERPIDPIQYVADYLHGVKHKDSTKKSTHSLPSSPEKISEQNEEQNFTSYTDNTVKQNGISEENGHQSRLDDFKESTEHPKQSAIESANERRTTQSEPPFSVAGSISASNPGSSISDTSTILEEKDKFISSRTNSLDRKILDKKKSIKAKKSTSFSRNLPAVAMSKSDYRSKRGLLPPMLQTPKSSPDGEPRLNNRASITEKKRPGQLAPLPDTFDIKKT